MSETSCRKFWIIPETPAEVVVGARLLGGIVHDGGGGRDARLRLQLRQQVERPFEDVLEPLAVPGPSARLERRDRLHEDEGRAWPRTTFGA